MHETTHHIITTDGNVYLFPTWLATNAATDYFNYFLHNLNWQKETIQMYGKQIICPRLTCWYGDKDIAYRYSGTQHIASGWDKQLLELKEKITQDTHYQFNSVLANLYRHGQDRMGWHSDNEKELGENPTLASVSLGAERKFLFKHKRKKIKHEILLPHGSLLIMTGATQHHWYHGLPTVQAVKQPRINLTYRLINLDPSVKILDYFFSKNMSLAIE